MSTATFEPANTTETIEWNEEFKLPTWTIPASWVDAESISKEGVVIHGAPSSPPCAKISIILNAYNIKHTFNKDRPKNTTYKKLPILSIGDKQINDSWVIIQVLAKILEKEPMTEEEIEQETNICKGLTLSIEAELVESPTDICKCGSYEGGFVCCLLSLFSVCLPCCGLSKKMRSAYPGKSDKTVKQWSEEFGNILKSKNKAFFSSKGESAGIADWSLFGLTRKFVLNGTQSGKIFYSSEELSAWYSKMEALYAERTSAPANSENSK